jgi:uncharacterized membrane protein
MYDSYGIPVSIHLHGWLAGWLAIFMIHETVVITFIILMVFEAVAALAANQSLRTNSFLLSLVAQPRLAASLTHTDSSTRTRKKHMWYREF